MSDHITPLRSTQLHTHPLIQRALAAVEAAAQERFMRVSSHVATRIYYPAHLSPLDEGQFFPSSKAETDEKAYQRTLRFLEKLQDDMVF